MDVRVLIVLIALFVLFVAVYAVSLRYWPAEHKALDKRHIVTAALVPLTLYLWHGEENRLVRNLEARGYTDVQIEHPDQWHCVRRWSTYSYRARSPRGTPVHGGACIMFFLYDITEPIGEKYRVLARMNGGARVDPAPAERKAYSMDVSFLIFLIPFFVLFVVCYVVSNRYWPAERKSLDKRLIVTAVLAGPMFYYLQGEEDRLVHHLESQGYTDVQIEHPNQWHCLRREGKYSYRARSPNGTPVHGGACVYFFIIETTEPIGEKYHRG